MKKTSIIFLMLLSLVGLSSAQQASFAVTGSYTVGQVSLVLDRDNTHGQVSWYRIQTITVATGFYTDTIQNIYDSANNIQVIPDSMRLSDADSTFHFDMASDTLLFGSALTITVNIGVKRVGPGGSTWTYTDYIIVNNIYDFTLPELTIIDATSSHFSIVLNVPVRYTVQSLTATTEYGEISVPTLNYADYLLPENSAGLTLPATFEGVSGTIFYFDLGNPANFGAYLKIVLETQEYTLINDVLSFETVTREIVNESYTYNDDPLEVTADFDGTQINLTASLPETNQGGQYYYTLDAVSIVKDSTLLAVDTVNVGELAALPLSFIFGRADGYVTENTATIPVDTVGVKSLAVQVSLTEYPSKNFEDTSGILQVSYLDTLFLVVKDVSIDENTATPERFMLSQNYPNPFNAQTTIDYTITTIGLVTLEIYNVNGQKVETLVNQTQVAGNYRIIWNATKYATGTYFAQIRTEDGVQNRKMVLLK